MRLVLTQECLGPVPPRKPPNHHAWLSLLISWQSLFPAAIRCGRLLSKALPSALSRQAHTPGIPPCACFHCSTWCRHARMHGIPHMTWGTCPATPHGPAAAGQAARTAEAASGVCMVQAKPWNMPPLCTRNGIPTSQQVLTIGGLPESSSRVRGLPAPRPPPDSPLCWPLPAPSTHHVPLVVFAFAGCGPLSTLGVRVSAEPGVRVRGIRLGKQGRCSSRRRDQQEHHPPP